MTVSQITFDCSISYKSVGPAPQPFRPPPQAAYSPAYPPSSNQPPPYHHPPTTASEHSPYSSYGAPPSYDYRNPGPPVNASASSYYPPSTNAPVNTPPSYPAGGAPMNRDYYPPPHSAAGIAPPSGYQPRPGDEYYRNPAPAPAPYNNTGPAAASYNSYPAPASSASTPGGNTYRDEYQQSPRSYDANAPPYIPRETGYPYDQSRAPPPPSVTVPHPSYGRDDYYQNRDPRSQSNNSTAAPTSSASYGAPAAEEYRGYHQDPYRNSSVSAHHQRNDYPLSYDSFSRNDPHSVVAPPPATASSYPTSSDPFYPSHPNIASAEHYKRDEYHHHYSHESSPRPYETSADGNAPVSYQRHSSGTFNEEYQRVPSTVQPPHERSPRSYGDSASDTTTGSDNGSGHGSFDHRPAFKIRDEFQYQQTREISPLPTLDSKVDYPVVSSGGGTRPLAPFPSMNEQGFNREREHDSLSHHSSILSQHSSTPSPPSSSPGEKSKYGGGVEGKDHDFHYSSYQQPSQLHNSGELLDDLTGDLNALNLAALAYTVSPLSGSSAGPVVDGKEPSPSHDKLPPTLTQFFSTTSSSSPLDH
jgi:hypothetical protein